MKLKKLLLGILSVVFSASLSLGFAACELIGEKEKPQGEIDYTAQSIVIEEREKFAPCYFNVFLAYNEHTSKYFVPCKYETRYASWYDVTIDGKEWGNVELILNKFPEGKYTIVIATIEGHEHQGEPCIKKITIPVHVSNDFEDVYYEGRQPDSSAQ